MRKRIPFALLWLVAVLPVLVWSENTSPAQTAGPQPASRQGPTSGKPASIEPGQTNRAPIIPPGYRLLSFEEGRAIAEGIAWTDDEEGLAPDCSHLVHTLYEHAGYPYSYVTSMDLYRGTGSFLRVRTAQPGDLIVWRGHVGIVLNPGEHSFFSSVTSGTCDWINMMDSSGRIPAASQSRAISCVFCCRFCVSSTVVSACRSTMQ